MLFLNSNERGFSWVPCWRSRIWNLFEDDRRPYQKYESNLLRRITNIHILGAQSQREDAGVLSLREYSNTSWQTTDSLYTLVSYSFNELHVGMFQPSAVQRFSCASEDREGRRGLKKRLETQQQLGSCRTEAFNVLFDRLAKVIQQECAFQPIHQSAQERSVLLLLRLSSAAAPDLLLFFQFCVSFMGDSN